MVLDAVAALFLGCAVYPKFPGGDNPEGSVRIGLLAALIPAAVDFTLGGAYEFQSRVDFSPRSGVRHEPFAQQPVGGVQPDHGTLPGNVELPPRLDVRPSPHVPQLHDLLRRRRQVADGLQEAP